MLHLDRKPGEIIVIDGGAITIKVNSIDGKAVKLSVSAPSDVQIMRSELIGGKHSKNTPV